jgi:hypothetical protein
MKGDKKIETVSSYCAFYDHEIKDFKNVQLKENIWRVVSVTVERDSKYNTLYLFTAIILFDEFFNKQCILILCVCVLVYSTK